MMAVPPAGARHATRARPSTATRPLRAAPLGRCLYCLEPARPGAPLTEEHLIPRALGGRATLRDAVCEPCRRITGRLEQATLDREFLVPRTLLALRRRRARGKGPSRLPPLVLQDGAEPATLTPDDFPRRFWLPAFRGTRPSLEIDFVACSLNLGRPLRDTPAAVPSLPEPAAYAWSIAKWAYTLAVATHGLEAFDTQPLRDLMLGRRDDPFDFVVPATKSASPSREWLHDASMRELDGQLVVTLSLFASAGMAPYEIAVGPLAAAAVVPRGGLEPPCP